MVRKRKRLNFVAAGFSAVLILTLARDASGQADWKKEWEKTLQAAKKEGRVAVLGPPIAGHREAIMKFQEALPDIRLEFTGVPPAQLDPRITQERKVGQYLWDVTVTGFGPDAFTRQIPAGWYDPIRPALILPEVLDNSKWLGGFEAGFMDKGKTYGYAFTLNVQKTVFVNHDLIPESHLRKLEDLLDPSWKGKIAFYDPRTRGPGGSIFTLLRKLMGDENLKRLIVDQGTVITQDSRQLSEWVVRGRYPIGIGVTVSEVARFQNEGVGLNVKWFRLPVENVTPSWGGVYLMNRAPNSHAAKAFINWLLRRDAQTVWAKLGQVNSRRLDVLPGDPDSVPDPKKLDGYINLSSEGGVKLREDALKFARDLLP